MALAIADPSVVVALPPEPRASEVGAAPAPVLTRLYKFIKNINRAEVIPLADGNTFVFPSSFFVTRDTDLAEELTSLASRYSIIVVKS